MRHLKMYRAIRLIARHGSIRKAAEFLTISPSALNRAVQGFEDELGQPVFERIPGGVRLSDAGELLIDLLDRHLTEFEDLSALLGDLRGGLAGTLRLSVGSDLGQGLVPETLAAFSAAQPGVSVEVRQADDIGALAAREVDLALLTLAETGDLADVLFAQAVDLIALPRGFGPDAPPPAHLWELVAERLIVPPLGTGSRAGLTHLLRKHQLTEGVVTSVPLGIGRPYPADAPHVVVGPKISLFAAPGDPILHLGQVQVMALRRVRAPLARPAQVFLNLLQKALDAAAPPVG